MLNLAASYASDDSDEDNDERIARRLGDSRFARLRRIFLPTAGRDLPQRAVRSIPITNIHLW